MNIDGPIIVVEDDVEDQELLTLVFGNLNYDNRIIFFNDGPDALDFLNSTDVRPFLILSDINMPKLDGFALRNKVRMNTELQNRCIPYLFFSTAVSQKAVIEAYNASVQGFFVKPDSFSELEKTVGAIMEYWKRCSSPNNF
ncbi:MAG: response regulator [Segetibacter sp.]